MTEEPTGLQLGAFIGVFTPTILTILGVIMFLRLGWVTGQAGLIGTLVIVVIANSITAITALSMSSLATNMKVGVGGAYYLISRSMGLELGGAVGIPLYLSQALSVTLYAYGLAETVTLLWADAPTQIIAIIIVILVTALAARSTTLVLKLQVPIMVLIAASLASLYFGADWGGTPQAQLFAIDAAAVPAGAEKVGFWAVFAVFFPAVTGVLAGVSMSGDLRNPAKAIPLGALGAVALGFVVYVTVPVVLAYNATSAQLIDPKSTMIWTDIAYWGWLVMPGCWGAILSSAFGSILGAPRTLQALAQDRLAPAKVGEVSESTGEPMIGLWVSGAVALAAAIFLPNLNVVAMVVTAFFLTTYGALNMVACLEGLVGDPSFRPRIRVPWWVSLLGAAGCMLAMFAISPIACLLALIIEFFIFWFLSRRSLEATWGDVRNGLWLSGARYAMLKLQDSKHDARNWRPHILVFTSALERNIPMVRIADNFGHHRGIVTIMTLLVGDVEEHRHVDEMLRRNRQLLETHRISAFCESAAVPELAAGVITVAQANGFGSLDSNTVMFGWPGDDPVKLARMLGVFRRLAGLNKCVLVHRQGVPHGEDANKIVLWWKGLEHNGDLMALLAHLLRSSRDWSGTEIVMRSVVDTEEEARERQQEFGALLPAMRIRAEIEVIVRGSDETAAQVIRRASQDARVVLLGLSVAPVGQEEQYAKRVITLLDGLPTTILVRNEGAFRGRLV